MLSVPLPIVIALMLAMLMLANRDNLLSLPRGRWFFALLVIYMVVLVLIGLRWSSAKFNVLPLLPILAVFWCLLTWIAFRSLSREGPAVNAADWPHLVPLVAVVFALFVAPVWLEVVIVLSNLFYAFLLAGLARRGADALKLVKFGAARSCHRAVWISALMLVYFAIIEVFIALDFQLAQGEHAAMIVSLANLPSLFLLGLVATTAGQAGSRDTELLPQPDSPDSASSTPDEPDYEVLMNRLTDLLVGQTLYADTELNLQRLARKAGVPARQVSRAVNSRSGQNVSQWVNEARINAACELLRQSDATVLEIMQAVGFVTKSNFNREFKRITGASPSAWREGTG